MHKLLITLAASLLAIMGLVSTADQAEARRYRGGHGIGVGIAAAVIGGIIIHRMHRRHHRRHYSYYRGYDDGYGYYPSHSYRRHSYYGGYGFNRRAYYGSPFGYRHHGHRRHW
jgi:uncharacterized membrane protein